MSRHKVSSKYMPNLKVQCFSLPDAVTISRRPTGRFGKSEPTLTYIYMQQLWDKDYVAVQIRDGKPI